MIGCKRPMGKPSRLRPVNQKRRAEALRLAFGEQADRCRSSRCLVCGVGPCDPHHEPPRSRGGVDGDTVPLCRRHHEERHRAGRGPFEKAHHVDLLEAAAWMRANHRGDPDCPV